MQTTNNGTLNLTNVPGAFGLLSGVLISAVQKSPQKVSLPETSVQYSGAFISSTQQDQYHQLLHWPHTQPHPCLPHLLMFPLQLRLMLQKGFPFSILGLVHLSNRIEQLDNISLDNNVDVKCCFGALTEHAKGWQFAIVCELYQHGRLVWHSTSEYLKITQSSASQSQQDKPLTDWKTFANWTLATDLGRQYASVGKDYNPIHLYPWSAKLFGLKRHILHGMYSKARCVSALAKHADNALEVEVSFKRPLFLPADVTLSTRTDSADKEFQLLGEDDQLHLQGRYRAN